MMFRCVQTPVILGVILPGSPACSQAAIGGEWREDLEQFAERLVNARVVPGMGIAVTQGNWVVYAGGFEIADTSGRGVGEETAFYIASSTKALTATAVVLLAGRGKLALDASVTAYLPALRFRPPLDAVSVTVRNLLTMTDVTENGGPVVCSISGSCRPDAGTRQTLLSCRHSVRESAFCASSKPRAKV